MNIEEVEKLITIIGSFGVGTIIGGGITFYTTLSSPTFLLISPKKEKTSLQKKI